ncbi:Type IV pilus biogenesis and competence protein PilQ precursor [Limihaloglobus sulfuriphilus]|uniref:Type IV pilus biogenesis and competence protein PilQ n=1 Tax=Limihaloglobus sulfuriphilus TaxID=1851148 RepID=A0A1Q2MDX5_9BACT|nr:hypothetical protein [Limihaloglobus sulfuriphilus]AQQ70844.1 Type IV pilus biogenesis and competence protein PilQ precursor [Limihaloglobus sulfuriphilus]
MTEYRIEFRHLCLAASVMFFVTGCGLKGHFAQKPTEVQARKYLAEASRVIPDPDVENPVPETYSQPPQLVQTSQGLKMFYYTRNQNPQMIGGLIKGQFGNVVTITPETNQLIISCADKSNAETIVAFLDRVDIPPIQVKIDCMVFEHYADITFDWETQVQILDFLGEDLALQGLFPGAGLREPARSEFGLDIGYVSRSSDIEVLVDMLVSRGYLKVLMNPKVETVSGKPAKVESWENVPITKIEYKGSSTPYEITEYIPVVDHLEVTPNVYSDGSIGLNTNIQIASKSTPEGAAQLPILTKREINIGENRFEFGESLVIGGFRKNERISVIRGVPFLKDIPFIGILFSSKDFEDRAKEVVFVLTPSVSGGGVEHESMVDYIRQKHAAPQMERQFQDFVFDPFGSGDYYRRLEKKVAEEEIKRINTEIEVIATEKDIAEAQSKLSALEKEIAGQKNLSQRQEKKHLETKAALEKHITEKKAELSQLKSNLEQEKQQTAELEKQLEAARASSQQLEQKISQLENLKAELEKQKQSNQQYQDLTNKERQRAELLQQQIDELTAQINQLSQGLKQLETQGKPEADSQGTQDSPPQPEKPEPQAETGSPAAADSQQQPQADASEDTAATSEPAAENSQTDKTGGQE